MPYLNSETGKKIYYERYGQSGPVLILLHGLASSHRIWCRQARTLQKYAQVYALDFPGHGQSDWQDGYSLDKYAEVVKALMEECGLPKAHLVALSMGCSVALTFAARYPERVSSLILEGPIGGYRSRRHPLGWLDQLVFTALPILLETSVALFGYQATTHWLNTFGVKARRNIRMLASVQNLTDRKAIRDLLWDSACAPYADRLEGITAPVLLVRGANDPVPRRFVNYIRSHLRQVTYVDVANARHLVAVEKPREFNALVMNFLGLTAKSRTTTPRGHSA